MARYVLLFKLTGFPSMFCHLLSLTPDLLLCSRLQQPDKKRTHIVHTDKHNLYLIHKNTHYQYTLQALPLHHGVHKGKSMSSFHWHWYTLGSCLQRRHSRTHHLQIVCLLPSIEQCVGVAPAVSPCPILALCIGSSLQGVGPGVTMIKF